MASAHTLRPSAQRSSERSVSCVALPPPPHFASLTFRQSLEHTLSAINKLNRSLEGVIAVGNEFGSVEALWSTFENVMGHDANAQSNAEGEVGEQDEDKTQPGRQQDQYQSYEREHRGYQPEERNAERR